MAELYFDGDPEIDSTRRRLERVLKESEEKPQRPRWPWKTALLASGTAILWWRLRQRRLRREQDARNHEEPTKHTK